MKGRILVLIQFIAIFLLLTLGSSGVATPIRALISRVLVMSAMVILAIAFVGLRDSVTVNPEPREGAPLITRGIYSWVRHPMYLAVLAFGAGMVVSKWTLPTLLLWLLLFIDLQIKYRYEDQLLAQKWPHAHEYQERVGALLPRIRR